MSEAAPSHPKNNERIILFFVLGFGLVAAALFCGFLFELHSHDEAIRSGQPYEDARLVIPASPNRYLTNFSLTDAQGQPVSRANLKGDFLVMSFVFTTCSTYCPIVSRRMEEIQKLTANQPDVRLVTLTVDPEDDTAPVLAKYGRRFNANSNRWCFLTGADSMINDVVGSILPPDTNSSFAFLPGNYAHSDRIALVTPQGHVLSYFDGLSSKTPAALVKRIAELRKKFKKQAL